MRRLGLLVLLAGCGEKVDGLLAEGSWGGEGYELIVSDTGEGRIQADCAHGNSGGPMEANDGDLVVPINWVVGGGPIDPDNPPTPTPVMLEAEVRGDTLDGVLRFQEHEGVVQSIVVTHGEPPTLTPCQ